MTEGRDVRNTRAAESPPAGSLSLRGTRAASSPLRIDYDAFQEAMECPYDPVLNPEGVLALNVAENRLGWSDLRSKLEAISASVPIPDWVPGYSLSRGAPEFRQALASFLSVHLTGCTLDPECFGVSAGATGVIEMTSFFLADPGDVAVIPAPCYPVYRQDIGNMAEVERYDLVTHHDLSDIASGPRLEVPDLERALSEIEASGRNMRMVILTTPDNPTGGVYSERTLREIARWCVASEVHLVVNEIYGLSTIDTTHGDLERDYGDVPRSVPFAQIMADERSDYLHMWYALSKDLGVSGLRTGAIYSHNADLITGWENLNLTHSVSNHTQWLLSELLSDQEFMAEYIEENRRRLTDAYASVIRTLRRVGVPYVPSRGSLFVWLDLSEFMSGDTDEAELALWDDLHRTAGILLTPGVGFGHSGRGRFRLVYPCVSRPELSVALRRLEDFIQGRRAQAAEDATERT